MAFHVTAKPRQNESDVTLEVEENRKEAGRHSGREDGAEPLLVARRHHLEGHTEHEESEEAAHRRNGDPIDEERARIRADDEP